MSAVDRRPRRSVAAYDTYADAQRAVDRLSDAGFPVEKVAIVGHGLRYMEQVTGRMTVGRAAMMGAFQGATIGALFAVLLGLLFTTDPDPALLLLLLYAVAAGALMGALLGALLHAATHGRHDFASSPGLAAERYEIRVDADVADRAAELLRSVGAQSART
jgi:hypothetical protein